MATTTRREFIQRTSGGALAFGLGMGAGPVGRRALGESTPVEGTLPGARRERFCFLHTYEATGRYWRGIEKAGLVRPGTGVRLVHSPFTHDDAYHFNAVARRGGQLHRILEQRKCHFIFDRVAGGSMYHVYTFDADLIGAYTAMLGGKYLGGQLHETVCNIHNDWNRFAKADNKFATEPIDPDALRSYFTWDDAKHWLSYGTLEDYAGRVRPQDEKGFWREIRWAARRQADRLAGRYSYCEGSHYGELVWHAFYKLGARYCLAEVGPWASYQSQFAIASLRGAAKAARRPWGVFFAPWGPKGCTSFVPEKDWSWQVPDKFLRDSGWPVGPELGPSSALQRRVFFHTYLSGAHTLHEEWGAEGNLLDWDRAALSSYGRVTRDLLDFQDAHPDVGEPYTPLALVLDATVPTPDAPLWTKLRKGLSQYAAADQANAKRPGAGQAEVPCYSPWAVPEVFDIVPSDAPTEVRANYNEIIRIGTARAPSRAKAYPTEEALGQVIRTASALSPLARTSHLPMQINRRWSDGAWIVGLYNPWGATRGNVDEVGSVLDAGCTQRDVLRPSFAVKSARAIHAWPAGSGVTKRGNELHVAVGAGGTLILEIE